MWAFAGVALQNRLLAARRNAPPAAAPQPRNAQQDQAVAAASPFANTPFGSNADIGNNSTRPAFRFNISWRPTASSSTSSSRALDAPAANARFEHEHDDAHANVEQDANDCSDVSADSDAGVSDTDDLP
eukprot:1850764-Pleurochrysis_carterae.AAC.2